MSPRCRSMVRDLVELAIEWFAREAGRRCRQAESTRERCWICCCPRSRREPMAAVSWNPPTARRLPIRTAKSAQGNSRGSLRKWSRSTSAKILPAFDHLQPGVEEMDINVKEMLPNLFGQRTKKRKVRSAKRRVSHSGRRTAPYRHGASYAHRHRSRRNSGIVSLMKSTRSPAARAVMVRCFPRGRATRHSSYCRRHHRQHALRHGPHRPHPLHRAGAFHVTKPSDLIPELRVVSPSVSSWIR